MRFVCLAAGGGVDVVDTFCRPSTGTEASACVGGVCFCVLTGCSPGIVPGNRGLLELLAEEVPSRTVFGTTGGLTWLLWEEPELA